MPYKLSKTFRFEASHRLPFHDGKCARLHGHSWVGTAHVAGDGLHLGGPRDGMVEDFGVIGAAVKELTEKHLDHYHLNDSLGLASPTSERVAAFCYDWLKENYPGIAWVGVDVEETCTSRCSYTPGRTP